MKARILSAAVLAPIAVGLTIAGGVPFLLGVIAMCAAGAWEASALLGRTAGVGEAGAWRALSVACAAFLLIGVGLERAHPGAVQLFAALALIAGEALIVLGGAPTRRSVELACGIATIVYVAGFGAHFVLLRNTGSGLWWVLLACGVTWCTDIGAFFVGRSIGAHPFFQAISPKKTLEGAIGGLAAGAATGGAIAVVAGLRVPLVAAIGMGLTISAAAQVGDLFESLLKREAGVKDSGTLIPGHGGILDRIDSLLVAVTVTFYWRLLFP